MSFCSNQYFVSWEQIISCRLKFSSAFGSFVHVCCNSVYITVVIAQCLSYEKNPSKGYFTDVIQHQTCICPQVKTRLQ